MELGNLLFGNSRGTYPIERSIEEDDFKVQELMIDFLNKVGCDGYGSSVNEHPFGNDRGGITTDSFIIRPYYWGDDEDEEELPNFDYNNGEVTIDWYKYALRDAYSNKELTYDSLKEVLDKCLEAYEKECKEKGVAVVRC